MREQKATSLSVEACARTLLAIFIRAIARSEIEMHCCGWKMRALGAGIAVLRVAFSIARRSDALFTCGVSRSLAHSLGYCDWRHGGPARSVSIATITCPRGDARVKRDARARGDARVKRGARAAASGLGAAGHEPRSQTVLTNG